MDSIGSAIDKLFTCDTKLWNAQDEIYKIRKMTFEEYKETFFSTEEGAYKLWEMLKKSTDLNNQRAALVDEIDTKLVEMIQSALSGENLDNGKFIQRKHKNY